MEHLKQWHIAGSIFTLILGTLLHFAYDWSGNNEFVSYLAPINESIWEHQKLLFTPMILFTIIELFTYGKDLPNFLPVKVLSILIGIAVIIASYYTYTGIIGQGFLIADIGTFVLGTLVAYLFSYHFLQTTCFSSQLSRIVMLILLVLLILGFVIFTVNPPRIPLFQDAPSGTYGR